MLKTFIYFIMLTNFFPYCIIHRDMERKQRHSQAKEVLPPRAQRRNGGHPDFYTGGGKRTNDNVATRNMIAESFLNNNTPFALYDQPVQQQNVASYPDMGRDDDVHYYNRSKSRDGYDRSRSHSRRRRRRHWHYDSSPSTSPERGRSRSASTKRNRYARDEDSSKSIVNID